MENKNSIMETILRLARVTRRSSGRRHDISHGLFRVLRALEKNGAMRTSDLAEALDIRPASLTEKLIRMEERQLISREKDLNDSRIVLVFLTQTGKTLLETRKKNYEELTDKLQNVLTESEQEEFTRISEKLISFFKAENPEDFLSRRHGIRKSER